MGNKKGYYKDYYARNKTRLQAYQREWKRNTGTNRKVRLALYGLTLESFNEILEAQNNRCACCGVEFDKSSKRLHPHVDHDHQTKEVRGILCGTCNSGIGHLGDSLDGVLRAVRYLAGQR